MPDRFTAFLTYVPAVAGTIGTALQKMSQYIGRKDYKPLQRTLLLRFAGVAQVPEAYPRQTGALQQSPGNPWDFEISHRFVRWYALNA